MPDNHTVSTISNYYCMCIYHVNCSYHNVVELCRALKVLDLLLTYQFSSRLKVGHLSNPTTRNTLSFLLSLVLHICTTEYIILLYISYGRSQVLLWKFLY